MEPQSDFLAGLRNKNTPKSLFFMVPVERLELPTL